jgi:hypothetical protein
MVVEFIMNKSVKVIPFPEIENAYIVISAHQEKDCIGEIKVRCLLSFFYADASGGAEWEPNYGPISVIIPCDKDYEGELDKAVEHWFYPFVKRGLYWSQCAVDDEGLPNMFFTGDYAGIFHVLKRWSKYE